MTVAVNVTESPNVDGASDDATATVLTLVPAFFTTCVTVLLVLAANVALALYFATTLWPVLLIASVEIM